MFKTKIQFAACAALLALGMATGCKSDQEKALEQAKAAAASTNTAQQIQYVDGNGDTVTTVVQPPVAGQTQQITTTTTPPAPGPKPAKTNPVVTPYGAAPLAANAANAAGPVPTDGSQTTTTVAPAATNGAAPVTAPAAFNATVPAGTSLAIRINERIDVKHTPAGSHFTGEVAEPVVLNGNVVIPRGVPVRGRVDASHRRGHFKGASVLELRLTSMTLGGNEYALDTHDNVHTKKGKGKRTAGWIGGMTGAGMLIGGIASGGVGLAIGAASGAGAGTLIAGTTGNRDIVIPAESIQHFRLADDLVVQH
ncbi:hypothetical protein ACFQBQ_14140 [Granulicella cerasi]|uniref:Uncharacterized protein n=1 Tax=Granulicella cerasi TaxID=741063 RepID=A0ABW1ZB50_9BACT|nr:hypothetical protein [Granulicella cerasi]